MTPGVLLCLLMLATFGASSLLLSGLVALSWKAGLSRTSVASSALDLLTLRLLPSAGALLVSFAVVLPAFLSYEPNRGREVGGPLIVVLASLAMACIAHGGWRAWRACAKARELLALCCPQREPRHGRSGAAVHIVDIGVPFVAVIGAWRPHIVAARCVKDVCDPHEFRQVVAHESAHLVARDNLKRLLLVGAPDPLAWTSIGRSMCARWHAAVEREADYRATGDDPSRRVALASALVKVARLARGQAMARPIPGLSVAGDDIQARVLILLGAPTPPLRPTWLTWALFSGALIPMVALPGYGLVHRVIEMLVGFGR